LLARGNAEAPRSNESEKNNLDDATNLNLAVPNGLLGVEIDGGLVPLGFKADAQTGDRVAVFGRWIVDTAHVYGETFRSEIHPPLLMARARIQPLTSSSQDGTRVVFTSRPYLVGQRYTLDPDKAYNDSAADDGPTLIHFAKEFAKVSAPLIPLSLQIEAHPKIKSHPFRGAHVLHIKVRPPALEGGRRPTGLHPHLAVSFQFTVRSGCDVKVTSSSSDTVDVFISLSDANYTPPKLPHRRSKNWSREEYDAMCRGIGGPLLALEAGTALLERLLGLADIDAARVLAILERGIKSDLYDFLPGVDFNDAQHAVIRTWPSEVSPGAGIVQKNDQPFPIFGWLEAMWVLTGIPV
jgi:hypothetical protein